MNTARRLFQRGYPAATKRTGDKRNGSLHNRPDTGVFHKGEHKKCFVYEAHTACDKNNLILAVNVTFGNIHDSVAFNDLYKGIFNYCPNHQTVVVDSAYKTPHICKEMFETGRVLFSGCKCSISKREGYYTYDYIYDEFYDSIIYPENQVLHYSTTNREGYREYKS